MKKSLWLVVILLVLSTPAAAEIYKRVVLYQDMAVVTLEKEAVGGAVVIDAPPDLIAESVTLTPKGGGSIAGVEIERQRAVSGKAKLLQELLTQKRGQLAGKKHLQTTIEKEIEIIYDAAGATRKEASFPRQRMVEALAFIDERVSALNTRHIRLGQEIDALGIEIRDLEEQFQRVSQRQGYRITIAGQGQMRVAYAVRNASWRPEYAVYATPATGELKLEIGARIWQATGMDWEAQEVSVSTGRPGFGIQAPEITPWYVGVARPRVLMKVGAEMAAAPAPLAAAEDEVAVTPTTTSYVIGVVKSVTLPGDGTARTMRLQHKTLTAAYSRVCVPKLDPSVFLRAAGTWDGLFPIASGGYTAFVDGEFCGRGRLAVIQPGEKMTVDLGRDEGLKVERKEEVFHEKTLTGKDKTTYTCRIVIENTRAVPVTMTVKDQIPVSQDEQITVALLKANPKAVPDREGIMTWEIEMPARTKTEVPFSFAVTGRDDR